MKLTFLGGADEVGASSTWIEIAGKRVLVDAGIRISPRSSRGIQNDQLPDLHPISEGGGPDYIIVTHAHTDHTGALPLVVEQYPHVPVLATRPTEVLTGILQRDAQRIMKSRQEQEGELPIFDEVASDRLMQAFQLVEFHQPVKLGEGLQVTFHPAGHIAGAAMLAFESEEGTLVMSGDVSRSSQRAVVSAKIPNLKADALVLESTYGGRLHANRDAEEKRLIDALAAVADRGGVALIPAFALGRAQEVLQVILAYRDRLDVPVYVDGMVRAVCQGYAGFADLLPESTVRAAGKDHLFFRGNIKQIKSAAMREQVATSGGPAVIVASSGMLTGGASVVYARHLAGDPRNAIFLTGYQDEEAPGRALQRMMKQRQEDDASTWNLDGKTVTLRCQIDTYSLSAHADEMELVNMAEAFDAGEVMLVHGDNAARHSLASALRQRDRHVITPRIGQTQTFSFKKRPWGIGAVASGSASGALDDAALWQAVKGQAGSFFSARELAQMWWGEAGRAAEAAQALADSVYFAVDWRKTDTFRVRSEAQVRRTQRQRLIMMAHPDIVGKLVMLRDSNERPRLGVVTDASIDAFEADVSGARGRNYPADSLLWVIGDWQPDPEGGGRRKQLQAMMQQARANEERVLPLTVRRRLVADARPVNPADLVPQVLPDDITPLEALLAVVMALARDGATLEKDGLLPHRAVEGEPMEQNQARQVALAAFPLDARMRKVGMEVPRKRLTLTFDFPEYAQRRYADEIERLEEQTGWTVEVRQGVSQQALNTAIEDLLPDGASVSKGPSYFMDRQEVAVELAGEVDVQALQQDFRDLTGFRLLVGGDGAAVETPDRVEPEPAVQRMEANAAYGVARAALDDKGLNKVGLKNGTLVLTFISPEVGARHTAIIEDLARQTGYPVSVHPHPNQQQILQVAGRIVREQGWAVRKGPGIHTDRAAVSMTLAEPPDAQALAAADAQFEAQTGYHLEVSAQG